jgi:ABC-type antimicrobial peptide transport system permease subunit
VPTTLVIRTTTPGVDPAPALRRLLAESAPGVELASAQPLSAFMEGPLAQPRLNAILLATFAGAAVLLAAIGLFGVMALMVRQRARELGVRMALGATAADVRRLVLGRGLAIAGLGTALGLAGAIAGNRLLDALLFETSPTDAPTLGAVVVVLLLVAALASLLPARAGARVEPGEALRAD